MVIVDQIDGSGSASYSENRVQIRERRGDGRFVVRTFEKQPHMDNITKDMLAHSKNELARADKLNTLYRNGISRSLEQKLMHRRFGRR